MVNERYNNRTSLPDSLLKPLCLYVISKPCNDSARKPTPLKAISYLDTRTRLFYCRNPRELLMFLKNQWTSVPQKRPVIHSKCSEVTLNQIQQVFAGFRFDLIVTVMMTMSEGKGIDLCQNACLVKNEGNSTGARKEEQVKSVTHLPEVNNDKDVVTTSWKQVQTGLQHHRHCQTRRIRSQNAKVFSLVLLMMIRKQIAKEGKKKYEKIQVLCCFLTW